MRTCHVTSRVWAAECVARVFGMALAALWGVGSPVAAQAVRVAAAPGSIAAKEYPYQPVDGGIEIRNGERRFNRPLYSSVDRPDRLIALAGDRPEFMVMRITGTKSMDKLANLKLGLAGAKWLDEATPVLSRHDMGLQHYEAGAGRDAIEIDAVRGISFEGLLLRVRCRTKPAWSLVLMMGGRGTGNYDQNPKAAFDPSECKDTKTAFAGNALTISGKGPTLYAVSPAPLRFTAAHPEAVRKGPGALLAAPAGGAAVAALAAEWPDRGEIHLMLTTDKPDSKDVAAYLKSPGVAFARAVAENRTLATAVVVETPDPYLDAALPGALLGYNAAWNAPSFRHGAIAWHDTYAGWRVTYGATVAGWHERAQSHMKAFYKIQHPDGRIPATLRGDQIYNMGEVLVDQALYDCGWTGDLEPLKNGGFDAIARHLAWGERFIRTPDGLYENFLNAWNTDYKWSNGGGGAIASAYFWRANNTMAGIAGRIGKDPSVFRKRADQLADAMRSRLWSEREGVFGEHRDSRGLKLLHESPDLSSIYTPIDVGFCTPFETYRSLRFALRRFETVAGLPRGGALIYSSEWLPDHYSTRGIYTAEILNTLLALYRIGHSEAAEPFRRVIDGSFFTGPAPGSTGYVIQPDGVHRSHTDFTDTTSMYIRNVVEGLFGVQMNAPDNRIVLQPAFPREWDHASIRCPAVAYRYTWDGKSERLSVKTPRKLAPTIRLRARRAGIAKVTANGPAVTHAVEPGIGCAWITVTLLPGTESQVAVDYGDEELPKVEAPGTGAPGGACTVRIDRGRIEAVRTSRDDIVRADVSGDGASCRIPLPAEPGVPTFFVRVKHRDVQLWMPVEVDVRPAVPAAADKPKRADSALQAKPVDLGRLRNQRLADLHRNRYGPRIEPFAWAKRDGLRTVQANGRSWWERSQVKEWDTSALSAAKGRFVSDNGIPFDVPPQGADAVFTSQYTNFPNRVDIPVNLRGRKLCLLFAASISLMQSRMENGRITVLLEDGTRRTVTLRDPDTIDDWLGSGVGQPYLQGEGRPQSLGRNAHAVLQEIDLGEEETIRSVTLETFTNETMIGLLGLTVMQEKGKEE